jgi:hypothetical protein
MSNFLDDNLNQSIFFDIIYSKMMKSFLTSMLATKIKTSAVKPTLWRYYRGHTSSCVIEGLYKTDIKFIALAWGDYVGLECF